MKKKIAFLLSMIMLLNAMPVIASEVVYGDADGNEELTANDSAVVLQKVLNGSYKMGIEDKIENYLSVVDVNADGSLTATDSAVILQKVLNNGYEMPMETGDNELLKLELYDTGWAYPNVVYWSLANYPEKMEHNYLITLYKNGDLITEIIKNISVEEIEDIIGESGRIGAHIDFSDEIEKDITGEYTFSIKALGNDLITVDSDVVENNIPYIYNDYKDSEASIVVSSKNTIQVKILNNATLYQWKYSINNDNIKLKSKVQNMEYHYDYDFIREMPGMGTCEIYNYEPISAGNVIIKFECCNRFDETDIVQSKVVDLMINDDLSVTINS